MLFEREIQYSAGLKPHGWRIVFFLFFFLLKIHSLCPKYIFFEEKMVHYILLPVLVAIMWQAVKILIEQIYKFWIELLERSTQISTSICHYLFQNNSKYLSLLILMKD